MTPLLAESMPSLAGPAGIQQKPYELTKIGVIFNRSISIDEYEQLIRRIAVVANATPWQIGDWLVAGTGRYEEAGVTYQRVHELTGRSYETIKQYLQVSLSFDHSERSLAPWTFYRAALRLPARDRLQHLTVAQQNRWTSAEFVEFINHRLAGDVEAGPIKPDADGLIKPVGRGKGYRGPRQVTCPFCQRQFQPRALADRKEVARG
jgi:hypothetical protein